MKKKKKKQTKKKTKNGHLKIRHYLCNKNIQTYVFAVEVTREDFLYIVLMFLYELNMCMNIDINSYWIYLYLFIYFFSHFLVHLTQIFVWHFNFMEQSFQDVYSSHHGFVGIMGKPNNEEEGTLFIASIYLNTLNRKHGIIVNFWVIFMWRYVKKFTYFF